MKNQPNRNYKSNAEICADPLVREICAEWALQKRRLYKCLSELQDIV